MENVKVESIYVAQSKFGKGVFASRRIEKGELICVMQGELVTNENLDKVAKRGRNIAIDPLQIGDNDYLNMDEPYVLINHSCDPNAGLKNQTHLVAIRNINKDEEVFYDYSTTWFDGFACQCGSKNCRKNISDFYTIPLKQRRKYQKLGIIPNFIKNWSG